MTPDMPSRNSDRGKVRPDIKYISFCQYRLRDIYTPTDLEVVGVTASALAEIKAGVPNHPWSGMDQAVLRCVRYSESLNLNELATLNPNTPLPEISQLRTFTLAPGETPVECQHQVELRDLTNQHAPSILSFERRGPTNTPPQMRIQLLGGSLDNRWSYIDHLSRVLAGKIPSAELEMIAPAGGRRVALNETITLGLTCGDFGTLKNPAVTERKILDRGRWIPTSVEIRDPLYHHHRLMADHVFPNRGDELIQSGLLRYLETWANQTENVSVEKLSKIATKLEQPLRISFWRAYEPSLKWFRMSTGQTHNIDLVSDGPHDHRAIVSRALVFDPVQYAGGKSLSLLAPHWTHSRATDRWVKRGSMSMSLFNPDDSDHACDKSINLERWRELIRLIRKLDVPEAAPAILRKLRALQASCESEREHFGVRLRAHGPLAPRLLAYFSAERNE